MFFARSNPQRYKKIASSERENALLATTSIYNEETASRKALAVTYSLVSNAFFLALPYR